MSNDDALTTTTTQALALPTSQQDAPLDLALAAWLDAMERLVNMWIRRGDDVKWL